MIRRVRGALGSRVRRAAGTEALLAELQGLRSELTDQLRTEQADLGRRLRRLEQAVEVDRERRRMELDRIPELRSELARVRSRPDYEASFSETEPLVSVRIAAYQRTRQLVELAIPSVLAQTYERLQVVVVNDGPNPRTREAIGGLGDPRIRYEELPARGHYPAHPPSRWRVAGTPAGNRGIELASGRWIATLDEDDEFHPKHVETLLGLARRQRAELSHGALIRRDVTNGREERIWSSPPQLGQFSFQGALYHAALAIFRYEPLAWTLQEPGDWNLVRRMSLAGVRMAATETVVGTLHAAPLKQKATHPWYQPS